jgi:uncharacterized protein YcaQ
MPAVPLIPAAAARRLFLGAQALLDDPARPATKTALRRLITALGFVQIDSINTLARAHHLVLHARLDGYGSRALTGLLERERFLFEHWTHDAAAIPVAWYPHWKARFVRDRRRIEENAWWKNILGPEAAAVAGRAKDRIAREGPLSVAAFEQKASTGGFWAWTPEKAALEYLWRTGELAVHRRDGFQKVYDLSERVHPELHACAAPSLDEHVAWAATTASARLVIFTPTELAHYWGAISLAEARTWCAGATRAGTIAAVEVEGADGSAPQPAFALADWEARLALLPPAPPRIRLLAPFDPVVRDRARCLRRVGFEYRFEAFTPVKKRRYGYYVLPVLEGDRLVGRIDPVLHRDEGRLVVQGLWWEPGVRPTRARRRALEDALGHLAGFVGATRVDLK